MAEITLAPELFSPFSPEPDPLEGAETPEAIAALVNETLNETPMPDSAEAAEPAPNSCRYRDGRFEVSAAGVSYVNGEGNRTWICAELRIGAETRDGSNQSWGLSLLWYDRDGHTHTWAMPREMLYGEPADVLREFASRGLTIAGGAKARELLIAYLQTWKTPARARCVARLGWHGAVFCTPDETLGANGAEHVIFQGGSVTAECSRLGTVEEWRDAVAALAAANTRLVFALSAAFAGPLLLPAGEDSGGLHLVGPSSCGKTTALRVAASVWGRPDAYMHQWRATANGLEGLAAAHNDSLLVLDELSQMDAKQAGEAAYMLANGKGKARASRSGDARPSASWRLLFLSSGELGLAGHIESAAKQASAGQEVRLVNIAADAGAGMGMFEQLHGHRTPAAFAGALRVAAQSFYGTVGRTYLRRVVEDRDALAEVIADGVKQFVAESAPEGASGQAERVARRFGLVASAGELATHYGLTGWPDGEASQAARACFLAWLEGFGSGNREDRALLAQVQGFLERHGASRFQSADAESATVYNRAGFWREKDGVRQYLVLPETFRSEVIAGFEPKHACKVLTEAGMLQPAKDRRQDKPRLPGFGSPQRVYVLTSGPEVEA